MASRVSSSWKCHHSEVSPPHPHAGHVLLQQLGVVVVSIGGGVPAQVVDGGLHLQLLPGGDVHQGQVQGNAPVVGRHRCGRKLPMPKRPSVITWR